MTDLMMRQDEHRIVDGTRELIVGRPAAALLRPTVAAVALTCHTHVLAELYGREVPACCQVTITPGRWYLEHRMNSLAAQTRDVRFVFAYCAPCAVIEYAHWGVTEADR